MTYKELRPPALVSFGLDKAISAHAENFQIEHPELILHLDLIPDSQMLSERVSFTLFRIYQQAMSNVLKHATARRVDIRLKLDEEHMILEVQDDGSGFTIPNSWIELVRQGHYGLASASERAEGIGGRLNIISHLDQGTLVQTVIPRSMILLK
jgi:signal transduction histidine kinase